MELVSITGCPFADDAGGMVCGAEVDSCVNSAGMVSRVDDITNWEVDSVGLFTIGVV